MARVKKVKWPKVPMMVVPLFGCAQVFFCKNREEWQQICDYTGLDNGTAAMSGCAMNIANVEAGVNVYVIGVFDGRASTLAHECCHAAFFVHRDCGIDIDLDSANEPYCYLMESFFSEFIPHLVSVDEDKQEEEG